PDHAGQQPAAVDADAEPVAEIDAPEEVDLVFRLQRRLAFTAGVVFLAATLAVPVLSIAWPAWYAVEARGGMTPNFAAVAFLLPAGYAAVALIYRRRADVYEERILGRREPDPSPCMRLRSFSACSLYWGPWSYRCTPAGAPRRSWTSTWRAAASAPSPTPRPSAATTSAPPPSWAWRRPSTCQGWTGFGSPQASRPAWSPCCCSWRRRCAAPAPSPFPSSWACASAAGRSGSPPWC